jgi:3-phosphoshikimate 1-carboxyvinyltransferase
MPFLCGGSADGFSDHRIAMAAAVAACAADGPVILDEPECVSKSYAAFWRDFGALQTE